MNTIDSKTLSKLWIDLQHRKQEHPDQYKLKSTGLKTLDKVLGGGVEPGQFVLIGGAQKSGKTTLLSCMTESFAKQGMKVLYLSGEMSTLQMGNIFFSRLSKIDRTRIRANNLDDLDWVKLERAAEKFSEYGIWWNHGFSSVEDITSIMNFMEATHNIQYDAIMVDYIQLMEAPEIKGKGNRVSELEYISRSLKRKTLERDKPLLVVAATQMNRVSIRGQMFDANSFLGSGSLERDMDIGMIIHTVLDPITHIEDKYKKEIVVVGSRETDTGSCTTFYNGSVATIEDLSEEMQPVNLRNTF